MKKLILLFTLLLSVSLFAQFENYPITNVGILQSSIQGVDNAVTVPDGKVWLIQVAYEIAVLDEQGNTVGYYFNVGTNTTTSNSVRNIYIPSGYSFYSYYNSNDSTNVFPTNYIEYDLSQQLSHAEPKIDNRPTLFPNPTNLMLSLNSEKNYNIQVFDLNGRKLLEQNGNSLNMEHLSNATYVVKAMDVDTKELLSYKVVKE